MRSVILLTTGYFFCGITHGKPVIPDDKVPLVKELDVKGLGFKGSKGFGGSATKPKVIKTAMELTKALQNAEIEAKILKEVDLKQQKILLFQWAGSGQDRITAKEKDGKVVFNYRRGLTRDLRRHVKIFVLRASAEYSFANAKPRIRQ